jgi:hypothetical protein
MRKPAKVLTTIYNYYKLFHIIFFVIYLPSQQLQGQLQKQDRVYSLYHRETKAPPVLDTEQWKIYHSYLIQQQ